MRHTIIINPIDSLIKINGNTDTLKRVFSSPAYCRAALDGMELAPGAKDILAFLRNNTHTFKTIIVTAYDAAVVRIIARHFNIPFVGIYSGRINKTSLYSRALRKFGSDGNDAVVVSGYATDVRDAETAGIKGLRYGVTRYQDGVRCLDDLIHHLDLRLLKRVP